MKKAKLIILLLSISLTSMAQIDWNADSSNIYSYAAKIADIMISQYEEQLPFIYISTPCDCYPCAMHCYEKVKQEPDYHDFVRYVRQTK